MKKILIIEDDHIISAIYRNKIELAGYLVEVAVDGEEGLKKLNIFKPDLVQLDLMLPKVNGLEIIKQIRSRPEWKTMPIIVLANGYDIDMFRVAWEAGANRCISKLNSSPDVVLDSIDQLLGLEESASELLQEQGERAAAASAAETSQDTFAAQMLDLETTLPSEIRQQFIRRSPQIQTDLLQRLQAIRKCPTESARGPLLDQLSRPVHFLANYAGMTGFHRIAHLADAFEVMLQELCHEPNEVTPSTLCTVAQAVDCLVMLLKEAHNAQGELVPSGLILAVDDDPTSRWAISSALARVNIKAVTVEGPELALKLLAENSFDLIFLDVQMPGMSGFELCKELRGMPKHKETPVVFVTVLSDFEGRLQSKSSGGDDLIAKPFLLAELAVKALTFIVQS
ncbi:MAG: response regulator [Acidobacteriia bacterium]|nr:response regulator [Terriglobia bacterium]